MNFKQFLSIVLSLFIFLSFSSCKTTKSNIYMKFIGQSFIQEGIKIGDVAQNNNRLYFLEPQTSNIFIASISNHEGKDTAIDINLLGSYFPETILRSPTSICSDENNTLFILETGDKINLTGVRLVPSSGYQYPLHVRAIYENGEMKEVPNLHLIKELNQAGEARKIRCFNDNLIIMFEDLNSILFLKRENFEKNTLSYFMLNLPQKPIDFDAGKDTFVVLLEDFTIYRYEYNSSDDNIALKSTYKLQNLTNSINIELTFSENENVIALYDREKGRIQIIKDNKQNISISSNGIYKIFKLKIEGNEVIAILKKEKGIKDYDCFIYKITV